jgi:hypothetical protein
MSSILKIVKVKAITRPTTYAMDSIISHHTFYCKQWQRLLYASLPSAVALFFKR